jgi:hypothetical protein
MRKTKLAFPSESLREKLERIVRQCDETIAECSAKYHKQRDSIHFSNLSRTGLHTGLNNDGEFDLDRLIQDLQSIRDRVQESLTPLAKKGSAPAS